MSCTIVLKCEQPECPVQELTREVNQDELEEAIQKAADVEGIAYNLGLDQLIDIGPEAAEQIWWLISQLYTYYDMMDDLDDAINDAPRPEEPDVNNPLSCNKCGSDLTVEDIDIQ